LGPGELALLDVGERKGHPVFLKQAGKHCTAAVTSLNAAVTHDGKAKSSARFAEATFNRGDFMKFR
jgi:hypothetical protein